MRRGGLVRQTYRVVRANAAGQTRAWGSRPPTMEQTEHQDLHVGGFLDWLEQSPKQKEFGAYFKQCLAANGVNFQTLDSKSYQMAVDEREFDPPAPPRPDSPAWAYLYGNMLVEFHCMADNLSPDNEYKRGMFESRLEPLKRKMKIHYGHLDWRGKHAQAQNDWEKSSMTEFQKCKAEVAAKAVSTDVDGFMELFRSNSHFQFGPDDPYHHYMPKVNEDKWVAYQKFQWDQTASNADTASYGNALQPVIAAADAGLSKTQFKAALQAALKSTDPEMVGQVVAAFAKASPSSCGNADANEEEMVGAVLNFAGVKGKLTAEQANAVSSMLRGGASGADLNGKSVAEATEILKDSANEKALTDFYHAASICGTVDKANSGQLAVALSFGNLPELYAGLFLSSGNMADFLAANSSAFTDFAESLGPLNTATANLGKALADGCSKADAGLGKNGCANSGVGEMLKATGFSEAAGAPVTAATLFFVPKLNDMAANLASSSFMGAVNCGAAAQYLATDQYNSSAWANLMNATLMPSASGVSGPTLQAVGKTGGERDFVSSVTDCASNFLVSSGKVAVPTREMTSAVEEAFAGVATAAQAVQQAQDAAAAKFMALTLDTGLADLGSLEVQYKS